MPATLVSPLAHQLEKDGFAMLPNLLTPEQLHSMQVSFAARLKRLRWNDVDGYEMTERYRHMVQDVLTLDQGFVDAALDPRLTEALREYVGPNVQLTEAKGWRSLPTKYDFHGWHGDMWYDQGKVTTIPREVKVGIYLTDVASGAFKYVRGTHGKQAPRTLNRGEADHYAPKDIIEVLGPAGSAFAFDTSGIHRQSIPILEVRHAVFFGYHDPSVPLQPEDVEYYRYHPLLLNAAFLGNLNDDDQRMLGFGDKTNYRPQYERQTVHKRFHRAASWLFRTKVVTGEYRQRIACKLAKILRLGALMHVVIVDADVSYPPTSGKRLRTLHLMQRLAKRHRLTYIGRCDAATAEAREARQYLQGHGIETILVDHPVPRKKGLAFLARLGRNVLSPLPYSVASHQSLPMRRALEEYAAGHAVDLWQFEWLPYMAMFSLPPEARRVVMAPNVDALIWQRFYETAKGAVKRLYLKQQWRKMERYERTHFPQATRVVAVSTEDAGILREQYGVTRVDVVDNGIDRAYFTSTNGKRDANRILFLGALDWRPNLDAVELLLTRIFPRVQAEAPAARLCIVGRHPPAGLSQRIRAMSGVELHADVPDVRPFLGQSGVMTVPLRIGGGSRLKILEALACGLPVVSTTVGAEGLCVEANRDFVQADGPEEMAHALAAAIRSPGPALAMAESGRKVVLERHDWDALAGKLELVWEKCVRG